MLKCSKEAFAACPDRHLCGCPEEAVFTEGSECDQFNRQIGNKAMTHADRIRAMSDEELAEFIRDVSYECQDAYCGHHCSRCAYPWCSSERTMNWLKQPVEVSGDA